LALVLAIGFAAPCAAFEPPAPTRSEGTPLSASTAAVVAKMGPPPARAPSQEAPAAAATTSEGSSFFGSTKGKLAVALLAAGVIITAVSRSKDAVNSPAR
jgi:hypothetical protein